MPKYIVAHDLGTSGNKASLFRDDGTLIKSETCAYPTYYPYLNCAEQNPEDWWNAVCETTREITKNVDKKDIAVISFSGQMMGCLCVDDQGVPLMNSIIWSDGRAADEALDIINKMGMEKSCYIAGQRISPNYTLAKLRWLKNYKPDIYRKTYKVLQAKDYMVYKMTGRMVTDPTDACYTQAFDIHAGQWSDEMLACASVRADIFPKVVPSDSVVGELCEKAANECSLLSGIPVVAGAGDGSAAHIGAGCVENNQTYVSLGSSSWIMTATDRYIFDEKCRMQAERHVVRDKYVFGGTMQTGGLSASWAKNELLGKRYSHNYVKKMIGKSSPGANGVMFLPYLMGERSPWWNADATAAFLGLRITSSKSDMVRAVFEGVCYNLRMILDIIRQHLDVREIVLIGGGARNTAWCRMIADIFGMPVLLSGNENESTGIGAAIIAGVGVGLFRDYTIVKEFIQIRQRLLPNLRLQETYSKNVQVFMEVYHSLFGA